MALKKKAASAPPEPAFENLIDYIRSEQRTFRQKPFCVADSLALSVLSYFNFTGLVPKPSPLSIPVTFHLLALRPGAFDKMCEGVGNAEQKRLMAEVMALSPRFRDMTLDYFVNIVDPDAGKQFSAVTVRLPDRTAFISYRGTDNSLTGWKENFNMAFLSPVPAQVESANYLNNVAGWTRRELRTGGHSKGGNLALYAAVFCRERVRSRIVGVYTHDSPGFKHDVYSTPEYLSIADRVVSLLPQGSKIGTLLNQNTAIRVVFSRAEGFGQHDPFSWQFENGDFKYLDRLSDEAIRFDAMLDNWVDRLTDEKRRLVVDAFFELIDKTDATTFDSALAYLKSGELTSYKKLKGIEPEVRRVLIGIFADLGKALWGTRNAAKPPKTAVAAAAADADAPGEENVD